MSLPKSGWARVRLDGHQKTPLTLDGVLEMMSQTEAELSYYTQVSKVVDGKWFVVPPDILAPQSGSHLLFVGPAESSTGRWEAMAFPSEDAALAYRSLCDYTKDWWVTTAEQCVRSLEKDWDEPED